MKYRIWEEISLSALEKNMEYIKSISNNKKIIPILKDDAYGHGAIRIASFLDGDKDIVAFAVATCDEALELKNNNVQKNILVLGPLLDDEYEIAIQKDIIQTVSSLEIAKNINDIASKLGKKAKIEIAIDTGMRRIGFLGDANDIVQEIKTINSLSNIHIFGIFSHYAVADSNEKEHISYSDKQQKIFDEIVTLCKNTNINFESTSIDNSAAIISRLDNNVNTIRPGIIIYGIKPTDFYEKCKLIPIMELKSRVLHIKELGKDESISYGLTYTADKPTKVAVVGCGYGDGYPRKASNKAYVLIKGYKCNIIGRVTMDMMMVDITDCDVNLFDEVVLIGKSGNKEISLMELIAITGEFPAELMIGINKRVRRTYI